MTFSHTDPFARLWTAHRPVTTGPAADTDDDPNAVDTRSDLTADGAAPSPPLPTGVPGRGVVNRAGRAGRTDRLARAALWPVALFLVVHAVCVRALTGSVTDDFTTVYLATRRFWENTPVYNENYADVDPHYLYNPGATVLLSPLGLSEHPTLVRAVFIATSAVAVIAALAWLTRIFGHRLSGWLFPAAVAAAFGTEAVLNTLTFANVNGVLLFVFVAWLAATLSGRQWAAGVALGVCILVKPMFAPLIVLSLALWHWRVVLAALAVPVAANLAAWPLVPGAGDYLTRVTPYLGQVRDYANSSLPGMAVYFGWPDWLRLMLSALCAVAVAVAVVLLARRRHTDRLAWLALSSGVLLAGVFLLSSLGQQYYSMMLFPAVFTVVQARSPMHSWVSWVALVLIFSPLEWAAPVTDPGGRLFDQFANTAGWAVFIVAVAAHAWEWWRAEKRCPAERTTVAPTSPGACDAAPAAGSRGAAPAADSRGTAPAPGSRGTAPAAGSRGAAGADRKDRP